MKIILPLLLAAVVAAGAAEDENTAWEKLQDEAANLTADLPEDEAEGRASLAGKLAAQSKHFAEFIEKFPASPNRWEARMALMQIDNSLAMLQDREPDIAAQTVELQAISDDKDAPENIRADAGLVLLQIASMDFDRSRTAESAAQLSSALAKFLETHPDDSRAPAILLTEAQAWEAFEPEKARGIYQQVAKDPDPEIARAANAGLEMLEMRQKPLELSFTAVDGRKVDLADLRGKVVLVDFWATWCPPCVEEAPALVEAYQKFKDQGFEIVGISLDEDKSALEKFTKEKGMTWPQFFDGKGWENELAVRFKIQTVPTMWLLDREGKLADPSPRGERLEPAITAALEAP